MIYFVLISSIKFYDFYQMEILHAYMRSAIQEFFLEHSNFSLKSPKKKKLCQLKFQTID